MKRIDTVITDYNELDVKYPAIETGFKALDDYGSLLRKGRLCLMGARPGMGRTTLSLQIALNVATRGKNTVFFYLDASSDKLAKRIIDRLPEYQRALIPLYIEDRIDNVKDFEKGIHKSGVAPELIVVDFLQPAYVSGRKGTVSYDAKRICYSLKSLAQTFQAAVLCTSTLKRAVELRNDHRPILTDIPSWSLITEYVDTVCFIYRDSYYKGESNMECIEPAEIILARGVCDNRIVEIGWNPSKEIFCDSSRVIIPQWA